jgi:Ni/Co efflux regulator RcnB
MKIVFATIVIAMLAATASAQTADKAAAKPAAKSTKPVSVKKSPAPTKRQAAEEAQPTEDYDPTNKLTEGEIAISKRVYTGEIPCELGAKVTVKPLRREGFFLVSRGVNRFVMHPVESRTGAIRLEDPARGALWLQLGNKSMLMNQKEGKRLADECQSPEQVAFANEMKNRPPVNILEAPAK